jgi:hypothetical protein
MGERGGRKTPCRFYILLRPLLILYMISLKRDKEKQTTTTKINFGWYCQLQIKAAQNLSRPYSIIGTDHVIYVY